jgi:CMP-N,N'-diacetyllegionaminic acid synthase
MMKNMKIICFIPARSGSTRVKNKNIRLINNRPLIYWSVFKAIKSKMFNKIIFSSDSEKYYKILIKFLKKDKIEYKNLTFDKRDNLHTQTKSKIFDYLKHDLIKKFNLQPNDLLVQMLPTCPLRSINTIKKLVNYSISSKKNSFSVSKYDFHLSFAISINDKNWKPLMKNSPIITGKTQSQTQKVFYHPNGALNCLYVKTLNSKSKSIYKNATPKVIPENEAYDIDNNHDFRLIKFIMENNEQNKIDVC